MKTLQQRIEALEKNQRRWKITALAMASILAFCFVSGAGQSNVPDVVEAHLIEVVDAMGKPVIRLSSSGIFLTTSETNSKASIAIAAGLNGSIQIKDADGNPMFYAGGNTTSTELMLKKGNNTAIEMSTDQAGGGRITMFRPSLVNGKQVPQPTWTAP